jgi:hypothetical protein
MAAAAIPHAALTPTRARHAAGRRTCTNPGPSPAPMPAEPRGSAHVATEATDTLLCRCESVGVISGVTGSSPRSGWKEDLAVCAELTAKESAIECSIGGSERGRRSAAYPQAYLDDRVTQAYLHEKDALACSIRRFQYFRHPPCDRIDGAGSEHPAAPAEERN